MALIQSKLVFKFQKCCIKNLKYGEQDLWLQPSYEIVFCCISGYRFKIEASESSGCIQKWGPYPSKTIS